MKSMSTTESTTTPIKSGHAWCCTAQWNSKTEGPRLERIAAGDSTLRHDWYKDSSYDITTSPDWMEWIETIEHRKADPGGAGAYDTMRCDLIVKQPSDGSSPNEGFKIWGQDFHLKRLQNSFASLLEESKSPTLPETALEEAKQKSKATIQSLLNEARSSEFLRSQSLLGRGETEDEQHTWIQMIKLTLLWSLSKQKEQQPPTITIRGHACSTAKPIPVFRSVPPITVTLAALPEEPSSTNNALPTRFQNPQSKVASWCRQRKKLEDPDAYKPQGVSEVLMTKKGALLEGLSSNVFVVYKDGTLRTPQDGVLHGYVRHVVLEAAQQCGIQVDTQKPISMDEADDWAEVFITSSSRLIWPVQQILIPNHDYGGFSEFWNDPVLNNSGKDLTFSTPKWQTLLEQVLHAGGYTR